MRTLNLYFYVYFGISFDPTRAALTFQSISPFQVVLFIGKVLLSIGLHPKEQLEGEMKET